MSITMINKLLVVVRESFNAIMSNYTTFKTSRDKFNFFKYEDKITIIKLEMFDG
jgi:hypothetical protein